MKKILAIIFAVAILLTMSCCIASCVPMETDASGSTLNQMFQPFEMELVGKSSEGKFFYYREALTDVIYVQYREQCVNEGMGGLTVMLDPETGLPLTYTRYMEIYKNLEDELRCTECGEQISANNKFCAKCGTEVKE